MDNNLFLEGPKLTKLVAEARGIRKSGKVFSDIVDDDGHYYVDLVQQGGGVLGIGLVGYTYILEQAGIRFYSLAGTSAGAINALLMAGLATIGDPVSVKILDILYQKNLYDFVDGPRSIKKMIQKKVEGKGGFLWSLVWNSVRIYRLLKNHLGLNPGNDFEEWLDKELQNNGISTYGDLLELRKNLPQLRNRLDKTLAVPPAKMAIITSEITTHTRVELPEMAGLYWKDVKAVSPAEFVHTSMAVPYLFYPFKKGNIPNSGEKAGDMWKDYAGYYGKIPPAVKFVDGGLLSNFPINVFHVDSMPAKPTFGARLSTYRRHYSETDSFFGFSGALVGTMRQIHDYEVILKNPDYRQLICNIDADKQFNWLNFNMKREKQKQLFELGAEKALEFLRKFDWKAYKETRQKLIV